MGDYCTDVKQDDNLTPIILIFVIQLLVDFIENEGKSGNLLLFKFKHNENSVEEGGQLICYTVNKKCLTSYETITRLYVGDDVLLFTSQF